MDDLCTCAVCYNTYDGDSHVPRLLPCSHTLCNQCVHRLREYTGPVFNRPSLIARVRCPQCLEHHRFDQHRDFPQNRYIIEYQLAKVKPERRDRACQAEPDGRKFEECREHSRALSLFCKEEKCEKAVCQMCLLHKHRNHSVVDIEDEENKSRAKFQDTCDLIQANIQEKIHDLQDLKVKLHKELTDVKANMEKQRTDLFEQINKHFETNVKKVDDSFMKDPGLLGKTDEAIFALLTITRTISDMQTNAEQLQGKDIIPGNKENLDLLREMVRKTNENIAPVAVCKHNALQYVRLWPTNLFGMLVSTSKSLNIFRKIHHSDLPDNPMAGNMNIACRGLLFC